MRILFAVALAGLTACWRGNETEATEPVESAPVRQKGASCEEVSTNTRRVLAAATDHELAKRADPIGLVVLRRCLEDDWSIELRRCLAGATTTEDADGCEKLATEEQQASFEKELEVFDVAEDGQ